MTNQSTPGAFITDLSITQNYEPVVSRLVGPQSSISWIGIKIVEGPEREATKAFFKFECPCGAATSYPINGLPEVDTPMPCGNKDHWVIKFSELQT